MKEQQIAKEFAHILEQTLAGRAALMEREIDGKRYVRRFVPEDRLILLGGDTQIGNDCVIGGSVWLTHAVEAGKMVLARAAVTDRPLTKSLEDGSSYESSML